MIICSHGRIAWFDVDSGNFTVLHEGRGVYYGTFPGEPGTLWVVSRPHNHNPQSTRGKQEMLLQLDMATGTLLAEQPIPTRFTHDAVRYNDSVYVADTGKGRLVRMHYPSFKVERSLRSFTRKLHPNTIAVWPTLPGDEQTRGAKKLKYFASEQTKEKEAFKSRQRRQGITPDDYYYYEVNEQEASRPDADQEVWALLHNKGPSLVVRVDGRLGTWTNVLSQVGDKSHGMVLWRNRIVMLSSGEGKLIAVDPSRPTARPEVLWADPQRTFLKGLAVVADVAYFGISEFGGREARDSPNKTSEVAAVDLMSKKLLWRQTVPTAGLLNVVAAPHLAEHSTYMHVPSWGRALQSESSIVAEEEVCEAVARGGSTSCTSTSAPGAVPGGAGGKQKRGVGGKQHQHAPAALVPHLDLKFKAKGGKGGRSAKDGFAEPVPNVYNLTKVDVSAVKALITSDMWEREGQTTNAFLTGRQGALEKFKPGVQTVHLIFSDQSGEDFYEFPWWRDRFGAAVQPIVETVLRLYGLDPSENHTARLQFARMAPGAEIKRHRDQGSWVSRTHRIHVPLVLNPDYRFMTWDDKLQDFGRVWTEEGGVFEINNALPHMVFNDGPTERIHLLFDFTEEAIPSYTKLRPGQECLYKQDIHC